MAGTPIAISVLADVKDANRNLAAINGQLQSLGKEATRTGDFVKRGMGVAIGAFAGAQVVGFVKDTVGAAAELQDTVGATGVIFKEQAAEMRAWGLQAAESMGLSQNEALKAAQMFGTFAKSAGLAGEQAASFAQETAQLAGDLASFFGGSVSDAVTAMGAALRGEFEPIRQYGVLLDDATLRQRALEMGLISTTKNALTPQQRVLAAHAAILAQTGDAQGDFERTSDQTSNTLRTLSAEWENLTTGLASNTLPAVTNVAKAGSALLKTYEAIPGPVKAAAVAFGVLTVAQKLQVRQSIAANLAGTSLADTWRYVSAQAKAAGIENASTASRLLAMAKTMRTGSAAASGLRAAGAGLLGVVGGPWGLAFAGATAAVAGFVQAQQNAAEATDAFKESLDEQTGAATAKTIELVSEAIRNDITERSEWLRITEALGVSESRFFQIIAQGGPARDDLLANMERIRTTSGPLAGLFERLGNSTGHQVNNLRDAADAWERHTDAVEDGKEAMAGATVSTVRLDAAQQDLKAAVDAVKRAFERANAVLDKRDALRSYREQLRGITEAAKDGRGSLNEWADDAQRSALQVAESIKDPAKQAKFLKESFADIRTALVKQAIKPADVDAMLRPLDKAKGKSKKAANETADAWRKQFEARRSDIKDSQLNALDVAAATVTELHESYKAAGSDAGDGFVLGLLDKGVDAYNAGTLLGARAEAGTRDRIESRSPSRVFRRIGIDITTGLAQGIDHGGKQAVDALTRLAGRMAKEIQRARDEFRESRDDARAFLGFDANDWLGDNPTAVAAAGMRLAPRLVTGAQTYLAQVRKMAGDVRALRKRGLNAALIQQILDLGPVDGANLARAYVEMTGEEFSSVNSAYSQAKAEADRLFGVPAAKKRVQALQGEAGEFYAIADQMGTKFGKAVRSELGGLGIDFRDARRSARRNGDTIIERLYVDARGSHDDKATEAAVARGLKGTKRRLKVG